MNKLFVSVAALVLLSAVACGRGGSQAPSSPPAPSTPEATPAQPVTVADDAFVEKLNQAEAPPSAEPVSESNYTQELDRLEQEIKSEP